MTSPVGVGGYLCEVVGCERSACHRGWCIAHYTRWRRSGDVGSAEIQPRRPNQICAEQDCTRTVRGGGRGSCRKHYAQASRRAGWQRSTKPPSVAGDRTHSWTGDNATYSAVHFRIRHARGPASAYACYACQQPAQQWAYDHADPAEVTSPEGWLYSIEMAHYSPMCFVCHKAFDREHRAARRSAAS